MQTISFRINRTGDTQAILDLRAVVGCDSQPADYPEHATFYERGGFQVGLGGIIEL